VKYYLVFFQELEKYRMIVFFYKRTNIPTFAIVCCFMLQKYIAHQIVNGSTTAVHHRRILAQLNNAFSSSLLHYNAATA